MTATNDEISRDLYYALEKQITSLEELQRHTSTAIKATMEERVNFYVQWLKNSAARDAPAQCLLLLWLYLQVFSPTPPPSLFLQTIPASLPPLSPITLPQHHFTISPSPYHNPIPYEEQAATHTQKTSPYSAMPQNITSLTPNTSPHWIPAK